MVPTDVLILYDKKCVWATTRKTIFFTSYTTPSQFCKELYTRFIKEKLSTSVFTISHCKGPLKVTSAFQERSLFLPLLAASLTLAWFDCVSTFSLNMISPSALAKFPVCLRTCSGDDLSIVLPLLKLISNRDNASHEFTFVVRLEPSHWFDCWLSNTPHTHCLGLRSV